MNRTNAGSKPAKLRKSRRDKYKQILLWILALCMLIPLIAGLSSLFAVDKSDIEKINKKLAEIEGKKSSTKKELESIKNDMDAVLEQKVLLDEKINLCNEEIELLLKSIEILEGQIADNNTKLAELNREKEEKDELFKERIRIMYEEGSASYLSVILQATSMSDFLSRTRLVADVLERDKEMLAEMEKLVSDIEETTAQLQQDKKEKDEQLASLEKTKAELEADYNESVSLMQKLSDKEQANRELLEKYDKMWKEASDEEERLTKQLLEQEGKKAETSSPAQTGSNPPVSGQPVSCIWPTPGFTWITSSYGYRYHPVTGQYSFHSGIDIGASYGSAILCIADGVVITNTYNSTYGNMIKVDHGNGLVSLYAHMNSKSKHAVGKTVKKGTVLGYVGSTGMSTGPHLHFTVYYNGALANPLNYVKPK
jgi:murein DD-endopeptidase MepM/ murein hydrolase activator NlpD